MINIKRFVDRVSALETKPGRDLVLPATEARALRDEIVKLLADKLERTVVHVEQSAPSVDTMTISGGKFR